MNTAEKMEAICALVDEWRCAAALAILRWMLCWIPDDHRRALDAAKALAAALEEPRI